MGNNNFLPVGPEVEGWVILKNGDKDFDPDMNDGEPYYYDAVHGDIWRRNILGWGPPLTATENKNEKIEEKP